jgi:hypothetical protein
VLFSAFSFTPADKMVGPKEKLKSDGNSQADLEQHLHVDIKIKKRKISGLNLSTAFSYSERK